MQKELRAKGKRKLYDGNGLFYYFMVTNGGQDIGTRDGKLHTDDPRVREAAIKSVEFVTNCYKEGYVPLEALTWNDADDEGDLTVGKWAGLPCLMTPYFGLNRLASVGQSAPASCQVQ